MIVETDAVRIAEIGDVLIQNLGDGVLYVGTSDSVSGENGIKLNPGDSLAIGSGVPVWGVSDESADVRAMTRVTGLFPATPAPEPVEG